MLKEELILKLSWMYFSFKIWILGSDVVLGYCRSSYSECLFFLTSYYIFFFKFDLEVKAQSCATGLELLS